MKTKLAHITHLELLGNAIPFICLIVASLSFLVSTALGRVDLAARGCYLALPMLLALVALRSKNSINVLISEVICYRTDTMPVNSFNISFIIYIITYLHSIILLLLNTSCSRPILYYALLATIVVTITWQIYFSAKFSLIYNSIILLEIFLFGINLSWSITLVVPLYFGFTDIPFHINLVESITKSGFITARMDLYQYFPIFHILNSIGVNIIEPTTYKFYYIFNSIIFHASTIIIYLFASNFSTNRHLLLYTALIYTLTRETIFNGLYTVTRTYAYLFFLIIFWLLLRSKRDQKIRMLIIFLVIPFTLIHQTTLVHATAILACFAVISILIYGKPIRIGYEYLLYFTVTYLGYWIYIAGPFFVSTILNLSNTADPALLPVTRDIQPTSVLLGQYSDFSIIVFLTIIGIVNLLRISSALQPILTVLVLLALVILPLYVPGPSSLISSVALTYRLPLMLSPIIVLASAIGLCYLIESCKFTNNHNIKWFFIAVLLVCLFTFSTLSVSNANDLYLKEFFGETNKNYFNEAELSSLKFITQNANSSPVFTDYHCHRFLKSTSFTTSSASDQVIYGPPVESAYFLYRRGEYLDRGQIQLFKGKKGGGFTEGALIPYRKENNAEPDIYWSLAYQVYDNKGCRVYTSNK